MAMNPSIAPFDLSESFCASHRVLYSAMQGGRERLVISGPVPMVVPGCIGRVKPSL
jgi:hypothetical protein